MKAAMMKDFADWSDGAPLLQSMAFTPVSPTRAALSLGRATILATFDASGAAGRSESVAPQALPRYLAERAASAGRRSSLNSAPGHLQHQRHGEGALSKRAPSPARRLRVV